MGRTCKSWRYHTVPGHSGHQPGGKCRKCWTPCRNRLTKDEWAAGKRRCDACVDALLQSPEIAVRRALADERDQEEKVLRVLLTDPNGPIALAAERALTGRLLDEGLEHPVEATTTPSTTATDTRGIW